jgi:hypothetical protein
MIPGVLRAISKPEQSGEGQKSAGFQEKKTHEGD